MFFIFYFLTILFVFENHLFRMIFICFWDNLINFDLILIFTHFFTVTDGLYRSKIGAYGTIEQWLWNTSRGFGHFSCECEFILLKTIVFIV